MEKAKATGKINIKTTAPVILTLLVIVCAAFSLGRYEAPSYAVPTSGSEAAAGVFDLKDGIYEGTGTGFAGDIVVSVKIKDGRIEAIEILSTSDDAAFLNRARSVIDRIIEKQSLDVDTVSGATYSSRGIINAVKNALTGERDDGKTGKSGTGAAAGSSGTLTRVKDADSYKDGTYYGTGTGFGGTLKVKVVIKGGKISAINIVEHKDGSSYMLKAHAVISSIITSQSTNVDTVSGATYSSVGIINAVRNALSQAAVASESKNPDGGVENSSGSSGQQALAGRFSYRDGIYYGTAEGYNGDITVAVVIQDKTIKAVLTTETEDDEEFFNRATAVADSIVKKQSLDVDMVSGATYSSKGILGAVKNALKEAELITDGGEPSVSKPDTKVLTALIDEASKLKESEYTEVSWAILQIRLQDARETRSADRQEEVDKAAKNLRTALNLLERKDSEGNDEPQTVYIDGIYAGSAVCSPDEDGDFEEYNLTLRITVKNDRIIDITEVTGDGDKSNESYIRKAVNGTTKQPGVVTQILESGSLENIDAVTNATCTSDSVIEACRKALEDARRSKGDQK